MACDLRRGFTTVMDLTQKLALLMQLTVTHILSERFVKLRTTTCTYSKANQTSFINF